MRIDLDIDEIMEQISDNCLLEEVKFRKLLGEPSNDELERLVNDHSLGKHGSSEALIKLCYDMVGKIV